MFKLRFLGIQKLNINILLTSSFINPEVQRINSQGNLIQLLADICKVFDFIVGDLTVSGDLDQTAGERVDLIKTISTYRTFIFTDGSIILDSSSDSKGRQRERGGCVDVTRRLQMIRILEKMERDPKFSEKLGIINKSKFISVNITGEKEKLC